MSQAVSVPSEKQSNPLSRLLAIAGERQGLIMLAALLSVGSTLLMFVPFVATYFIVAELLQHTAVPTQADVALIRWWGMAAFIALILAIIFIYVSTLASHVAAFRILYRLRLRLAHHLSLLPMGYHTRSSTGAIKKVVELNVEKIEGFIAHQIPDIVGAITLPVVMLIAMFWLDWRLALATALPVVGAFVLQAAVWLGSGGDEKFRAYQKALEDMNAAGVEYVRGMPAVKVFGLTAHSFLSFRDAILGYRDLATYITKFSKHPFVTFNVMLTSILSFIVPAGIFLLSRAEDKEGFALIFVLFIVLAPGLSLPVMKLLYLATSLRLISEGVERVDEILNQPPLLEPAQPATPQGYTIEFRNVSFAYNTPGVSNRPNALSNVSFTAVEGQLTALVGPSGSGKSTIANLIPRFWDVDQGQICLGGVDIRQIGSQKLMEAVSFVFQDVHLFYDTIEENIRMGNQQATTEQLIEAATLARCHSFIEQLPQGYQTRIGEGGTHLSGGEAQRVAIARALLKNAPVLVLDEATAFADPENEAAIQEGLNVLVQDKTVIVIAHRLSTIRQADQILVLDGGQIVERGRHDELLAADGLYGRMWQAHIGAGAWTLADTAVTPTN